MISFIHALYELIYRITRFIARALIFSTKLTTGPLFKPALIQASALVIFKVKLAQKLSLKTNISRH